MNKIAAIFRVPDMSPKQYRQVMKDLEASGAKHPKGRLSHIASNAEKGMVVVDTYDSPESLQSFGATLMPILVKNGVTPPQPEVVFVENEVFPA
jgi:hypothetical protein